MKTEWTKEAVHFMFEKRDKTVKGIFVNEPFISARFDECQQLCDSNGEYSAHQFPKILALGIMLLEIELGIKIEDHRLPETLNPDDEPTVYDDHATAVELLRESELWERRETIKAFKEMIEICLIPEPFMPYVDDVQGLRDAFKKLIMNPLQVLYKEAWENPEESSVFPIELDLSGSGSSVASTSIPYHGPPSTTPFFALLPTTSDLQRQYNPRQTHSTAAQHCESIYSSIEFDPPSVVPFPSAALATSSNITSEAWFSELDRFNSVLSPRRMEKDDIYQPVKIAILDTGVNEKHADSIEDFKDFVSGDDDNCQDKTGHGTHAFRLIEKVYRMARIYVGRVFDGSHANDKTATLMADAVQHAMKTWQVDIIVMPSGFQTHDSDLEKAIEDARNARILIFAAASNYGNATGIVFPGRLYIDLKVFCMFATAPNVRALPDFNPSVLSNARYNFAILGHDIKISEQERPLSGTSFSTMIGGAVAARILDFARHKDNRETIRQIDRLHTVEGMSAVFDKMVKGGVDNGYHCMAPWKMLPILNTEEPRERRLRGREYIRETISRALEGMYGG